MNLRKWMKLFGTTILIGALAAMVTGVCMQLTDPDFRNIAADGWLYNILMMSLIGLTFGAFAHMGFFAYLMLNYISRSIFKRPYTWVALQGFIALFVLVEIAYWTYDSNFPIYTFWVVPLLLLVASVVAAWRKTRETTEGAWIPTLFFLIVITVLEGIPAFRTGQISSLIFQLIPLFVCNVYQIMQLHRILGDKAIASSPTEAA
ncbi:KinB-signaling pathway activation protein [Cohnella sp.]|uniref:KinB-signaling pathway activation protein n=1 Tax=Cohnella sp. TaxID=1883426 RepID=UPI0035615F80